MLHHSPEGYEVALPDLVLHTHLIKVEIPILGLDIVDRCLYSVPFTLICIINGEKLIYAIFLLIFITNCILKLKVKLGHSSQPLQR